VPTGQMMAGNCCFKGLLANFVGLMAVFIEMRDAVIIEFMLQI